MNTSSSDRCTRISPSAVLDDRLAGKDLEWARDHLRRCESCRERVEEFREMLMRVGRLPSAAISAAAMDEAFAASIPEPVRAGATGGSRRFDLNPPAVDAPIEPILDLPPQPVRPEVSNVRDLLSDLEREIFRDEPAQDHPTAMPAAAASSPAAASPARPEIEAATEVVVPEAAIPAQPIAPPTPPDEVETDLREVAVDSRWSPTPVPQEELVDLPRIDALPPPDASHRDFELAGAGPADAAALTPATDAAVEEPAGADAEQAHSASVAPDDSHHAWIAPQESSPATGDRPPAAARRNDTIMRVAVGLAAAACVLLAAFLYEGGLLSRAHRTAATGPTAHATASASARPSASAVASPSASPAAPAAPVLFRLGNGVTGGTVYRIRPGTAVAGYTRLVFDIRGRGLPGMVITQPDTTHVAITFEGTSGTAVPVKGIRSYQVAGVEPAVQQGPDLVITVDLARPVRVTAFTLPAAGAYSPRLVVDLHTS